MDSGLTDAQTRKESVSDQLFGARLCYFTTHAFINLILLTYDCDLSIQIKERRFFFPIIYLLSTLLAAWAFINAGGDPGFVGHTIEGWQEISEPIELKEGINTGHFNDGTRIDDQDFFQVHEHRIQIDEEDEGRHRVDFNKQPYQSLDGDEFLDEEKYSDKQNNSPK